MSSQLHTFLTEKKIDVRRLLATSARIERLTAADRAIRLEKRQARAGEDAAAKKAAAAKKYRSGRPVTSRALSDLHAGKAVSGPVKTRILRAVNAILEQKKEAAASLRDLFGAKKAG
jgi:hypothetical protein